MGSDWLPGIVACPVPNRQDPAPPVSFRMPTFHRLIRTLSGHWRFSSRFPFLHADGTVPNRLPTFHATAETQIPRPQWTTADSRYPVHSSESDRPNQHLSSYISGHFPAAGTLCMPPFCCPITTPLPAVQLTGRVTASATVFLTRSHKQSLQITLGNWNGGNPVLAEAR